MQIIQKKEIHLLLYVHTVFSISVAQSSLTKKLMKYIYLKNMSFKKV